MKLAWPIELVSTGVCLPDRVVLNDHLAETVDTSDEWIVQRTGISQRRWSAEGQSTLALATDASREALKAADATPQDLDAIVVATITPEHPLPATATLLQAELGCGWIPAYDMAAACSGFVWALLNACQHVVCGMAERVLVVGAECLTTITDMQDRATCILFGDAAGAVVLRKTDDPDKGILAARWGADGDRGRLIMIPAGGSKHPASHTTIDERMHYMKMAGREVYKFAVTQMEEVIRETCADAGVSIDDVKLIVPHQSNLRIIESACKRAGLSMERVLVNIDRYGNTSAASVPVALHEALQSGRCAPGDLVLLVAFGAGLTWGSALLRI